MSITRAELAEEISRWGEAECKRGYAESIRGDGRDPERCRIAAAVSLWAEQHPWESPAAVADFVLRGDLEAHQGPTTQRVVVARPHVPHGPKGVPADVADADYLRSAAGQIRASKLFGSNLRETIAALVEDAANAIEHQVCADTAEKDAAALALLALAHETTWAHPHNTGSGIEARARGIVHGTRRISDVSEEATQTFTARVEAGWHHLLDPEQRLASFKEAAN